MKNSVRTKWRRSLASQRLMRAKAKRKSKVEARHPILTAVERLISSISDIRICSANYIPAARTARHSDLEACGKRLDQLEGSLTALDEDDVIAAREISELQRVVRSLRKTATSRAPQILQQSLYVHLFSVFDTFVGDLIRALFSRRSELFEAFDRQISFKDMLGAVGFDVLKDSVLAKEIENVRRQSYLEQFKWIENFFDIKIREWKDWPAFIEASQRRNLYVHANGVVSEQYLTACKNVGFKLPKNISAGDVLPLKDGYFSKVTELVFDAGVQLAHTLWRKMLTAELRDADDALIGLVYDLLIDEAWGDARRTGGFFTSQRKFSSDLNRRIGIVNLAIAYKFSGSKEYKSILDKEDWSSSLPEFSLAVPVLNDNFVEAARIMLLIGDHGVLLNELQYHEWPLLRDFRQSSEFLESYVAVYGRNFIQRAEEVAHEAASN